MGSFRWQLLAWLQRLRPWLKLKGEVKDCHIVLDNLPMINAKVTNCAIHYGGGRVLLEGTNFAGCSWHFFGAAARALILVDTIGRDDPPYFLKSFPQFAESLARTRPAKPAPAPQQPRPPRPPKARHAKRPDR